MTEIWSQRAAAYRESEAHREGRDLDLIVEWAEGARTALDVATGGGHTARRLREAGVEVATVDPAPGMEPDVIAPAEHLPLADESFDLAVTRVAAHHFADVPQAVRELARVSRRLVIVADNLHVGVRFEEGERLRDPTHVRCYTESEWRKLFADAGLMVDEIDVHEKRIELDAWLRRAGCEGDRAEGVRRLVEERIDDGHVTLTRIVLKGRKR